MSFVEETTVSRCPRPIAGTAGPLLALALALGCASPTRQEQPEIAAVYLEAGRYEDAAREAEIALRRRPDDVALRKLAARAHQGLGDVDRAIAHLEMAFDQAPADPEISVALGELEQQRENLPDAYVAFRRATELAPGDIRAWSGLALAAEALGFENEAVDAYARWAELERQEQGLEPSEQEGSRP